MGHPVTAIVKTLLDQVIMAPAGIALFFTALGVLEGKPTGQVGVTKRDWGCMICHPGSCTH
jgi:glycerol uptake facilitator-like aquaporin